MPCWNKHGESRWEQSQTGCHDMYMLMVDASYMSRVLAEQKLIVPAGGSSALCANPPAVEHNKLALLAAVRQL
jgi:hypothetical protein